MLFHLIKGLGHRILFHLGSQESLPLIRDFIAVKYQRRTWHLLLSLFRFLPLFTSSYRLFTVTCPPHVTDSPPLLPFLPFPTSYLQSPLLSKTAPNPPPPPNRHILNSYPMFMVFFPHEW